MTLALRLFGSCEARSRSVRVVELMPNSDSALLKNHRILVAPTVLVLDRDGRQLSRFEGESVATLDPIHKSCMKWCIVYRYQSMGRTNIEIDESLIRKARKLTRLKTKRQIVDKALELLVRSESRKGILRFYGSGVWKGDLKASRRNHV
jgi:Arc/MetJ family transcription regulator